MTVEMAPLGRSSWERLGIGARVLAIALLLGSVAVAAVWLPETWRIIGAAASLLALSLAAVVDLAEHRLPNVLVGAGAAAVVVALVLVATVEGGDAGGAVAVSALIGVAVTAGPLFLMHLVSPRGMGFGDVKAAVVLGATMGLVDGWVAIVAVLVASLATSVVGLVMRRNSVPFGPGLVAGTIAAFLVAAAIGTTPVA